MLMYASKSGPMSTSQEFSLTLIDFTYSHQCDCIVYGTVIASLPMKQSGNQESVPYESHNHQQYNPGKSNQNETVNIYYGADFKKEIAPSFRKRPKKEPLFLT